MANADIKEKPTADQAIAFTLIFMNATRRTKPITFLMISNLRHKSLLPTAFVICQVVVWIGCVIQNKHMICKYGTLGSHFSVRTIIVIGLATTISQIMRGKMTNELVFNDLLANCFNPSILLFNDTIAGKKVFPNAMHKLLINKFGK